MTLVHKDCNFQSRIDFVLKGRKKYPWAASAGIPTGSVDRMFKGEIPGPEILGLIMRAENVSITWLTEGVGAPYLVSWFPTDEGCRQHLDELLTQPGWYIHLLTDGGRVRVLVLYGPAEVEYKGRSVPYTELAVLAGVGPATVARVHALESHRETLSDTETVADVAAGRRAGTWDLLGNRGLLNQYITVEKTALRVAESSDAAYDLGGTDATSREERQWIELIRRLDSHSRVRLKEVGDAFAAAMRRDRPAGNDDSDD